MGPGSRPTIPALLAAAAEQHPAVVAVSQGGVRLSYAELHLQARAVGAGFVRAGIEPGDRIAIWAPNSSRWIIAALGVWEAGAVLVPINTRFKGPEAADIIERSGARALLTVTDFLGVDHLAMLRGTQARLPTLRETVVLTGAAPKGATSYEELLASGTADEQAEVARRAVAVGPDDPSDILFTSGTTGKAKGVVQTHGRTLHVATDWAAMTGLRVGDRYLMVNPYFHMFGLKAGILASVATGATMFPEPTFEVDRVLESIERDAITVLPGAPTIYQALLDAPRRCEHDLSSLRVAVTGAADIPVELIRRVYTELPFSVVIAGYGLTEAGTASGTDPDDDPEIVATTVGRPRPGFEVRIVDQYGTDVPQGGTGEILLRGPSVMSHYLDDPEATASVLSPDGWLGTGDLGVLDEAGRLRIVGRSKDMFIVGGFNAYPAEIENVLLGHPAVAQVAVVGIPDQRLGEVGMAFIVPNPGETPSRDEIIAWSRERMANYKVPRRVELVESLPTNATGKVVKAELRARALGG
jgi:acyl-CoA synthetase (AMP-forming)/AMP-acid ligase II